MARLPPVKLRFTPSPAVRRIGLYTGGFIGPFGANMVVVLIPDFRDIFHVTTTTASLSLTMYLIPFAGLQLISGTVGERFGRDPVLRFGFLIYALASIAAAITTSIVPFLITRAIQGGANAFTNPLALAKLAQATPKEELGKAMGTYGSVQTSAMVMAPLIGGLAGAIDYRLAFIAAAVAALILMVIVPEKKPKPSRHEAPSFRSIFTARMGWLCLTGSFFFMSTVGLAIVIALKAADEFGVAADWRGLILASFGFAGMMAGRPSGKLLDKVGVRRVLWISIGATAAVLSLLTLANNTLIISLLWFLTGGTSAMVATTLNTLSVGASLRNPGGAISAIASVRFIGAAAAPLVWVPVYHANSDIAFLIAAGLMGIVAFGAMRAVGASTGPPALAATQPEPATRTA
jgi:MFS family permease